MDQGQCHARGLGLALCCDRMMQMYQKILICQRKSIKFKPLSCLSQISDTKLTFVFCGDHSFWSNEEIASVGFVAAGVKSMNVTDLLASLLSLKHY